MPIFIILCKIIFQNKLFLWKKVLKFVKTKLNRIHTMTEREKRDKQLVLNNAYLQLKLTTIEEDSFLAVMSKRELKELRDEILDKILQLERELGIRQ
jgi:hypothetical protein